MPLLPGRDGCAHLPRSFDIIGAELHGNAAVLWPRHAQIDIRKCPLLAIALVVDAQIAAFKADLREISTIQRADVKALDPGKQRGEFGYACPSGKLWAPAAPTAGRRMPSTCPPSPAGVE